MRLGICLAHPEHIVRLPAAKYRRYHKGANTTCVKSSSCLRQSVASAFNTSTPKRGTALNACSVVVVAAPRSHAVAGTSYTEADHNNAADVHNFTPIAHGVPFTNITSLFTPDNDALPFVRFLNPRSNVHTTRNASSGFTAIIATPDANQWHKHMLFGNCVVPVVQGMRIAIRGGGSAPGIVYELKQATKTSGKAVYCWNIRHSDLVHKYKDGTVVAIPGVDLVDSSVPRGPFRYLTENNAVDVWTGRGFQMHQPNRHL